MSARAFWTTLEQNSKIPPPPPPPRSRAPPSPTPRQAKHPPPPKLELETSRDSAVREPSPRARSPARSTPSKTPLPRTPAFPPKTPVKPLTPAKSAPFENVSVRETLCLQSYGLPCLCSTCLPEVKVDKAVPRQTLVVTKPAEGEKENTRPGTKVHGTSSIDSARKHPPAPSPRPRGSDMQSRHGHSDLAPARSPSPRPIARKMEVSSEDKSNTLLLWAAANSKMAGILAEQAKAYKLEAERPVMVCKICKKKCPKVAGAWCLCHHQAKFHEIAPVSLEIPNLENFSQRLQAAQLEIDKLRATLEMEKLAKAASGEQSEQGPGRSVSTEGIIQLANIVAARVDEVELRERSTKPTVSVGTKDDVSQNGDQQIEHRAAAAPDAKHQDLEHVQNFRHLEAGGVEANALVPVTEREVEESEQTLSTTGEVTAVDKGASDSAVGEGASDSAIGAPAVTEHQNQRMNLQHFPEVVHGNSTEKRQATTNTQSAGHSLIQMNEVELNLSRTERVPGPMIAVEARTDIEYANRETVEGENGINRDQEDKVSIQTVQNQEKHACNNQGQGKKEIHQETNGVQDQELAGVTAAKVVQEQELQTVQAQEQAAREIEDQEAVAVQNQEQGSKVAQDLEETGAPDQEQGAKVVRDLQEAVVPEQEQRATVVQDLEEGVVQDQELVSRSTQGAQEQERGEQGDHSQEAALVQTQEQEASVVQQGEQGANDQELQLVQAQLKVKEVHQETVQDQVQGANDHEGYIIVRDQQGQEAKVARNDKVSQDRMQEVQNQLGAKEIQVQEIKSIQEDQLAQKQLESVQVQEDLNEVAYVQQEPEAMARDVDIIAMVAAVGSQVADEGKVKATVAFEASTCEEKGAVQSEVSELEQHQPDEKDPSLNQAAPIISGCELAEDHQAISTFSREGENAEGMQGEVAAEHKELMRIEEAKRKKIREKRERDAARKEALRLEAEAFAKQIQSARWLDSHWYSATVVSHCPDGKFLVQFVEFLEEEPLALSWSSVSSYPAAQAENEFGADLPAITLLSNSTDVHPVHSPSVLKERNEFAAQAKSAKWTDGYWYAASVLSHDEGVFVVQFTEFPEQPPVSLGRDFVSLLEPEEANMDSARETVVTRARTASPLPPPPPMKPVGRLLAPVVAPSSPTIPPLPRVSSRTPTGPPAPPTLFLTKSSASVNKHSPSSHPATCARTTPDEEFIASVRCAQWSDGHWYAATVIQRVENDKFLVEFTDYLERVVLPLDRISTSEPKAAKSTNSSNMTAIQDVMMVLQALRRLYELWRSETDPDAKDDLRQAIDERVKLISSLSARSDNAALEAEFVVVVQESEKIAQHVLAKKIPLDLELQGEVAQPMSAEAKAKLDDMLSCTLVLTQGQSFRYGKKGKPKVPYHVACSPDLQWFKLEKKKRLKLGSGVISIRMADVNGIQKGMDDTNLFVMYQAERHVFLSLELEADSGPIRDLWVKELQKAMGFVAGLAVTSPLSRA